MCQTLNRSYCVCQLFGTAHGRNVALLVDCSDASFGFGRRTAFIQGLTVSIWKKCSDEIVGSAVAMSCSETGSTGL